LIILLLILGVVILIFFIIKKKKSQPTTRIGNSYGSQSSSSVKPGQGRGGRKENTPQFAEFGYGKPGERRLSKDGYTYMWNDILGWVKQDTKVTYVPRNHPDGQDGKGKGGKGKDGGGGFLDAYGNYLAAAGEVVAEIIPLFI